MKRRKLKLNDFKKLSLNCLKLTFSLKTPFMKFLLEIKKKALKKLLS